VTGNCTRRAYSLALSSQDINSAQHIMQLMLQVGLELPGDFVFQVRTEEQRILEEAEAAEAAEAAMAEEAEEEEEESEQAEADAQELEAM